MSTQKGFTLVELLVVIVIISILGVVVIAALNPGRLITRTKDTVLNYHLRTFAYVIDSIHSADGNFPTKSQLLDSLKNAHDLGEETSYFSFPVRAGADEVGFSYVVSSDGAISCLSTATDDGRNLLWCSNANDIRDTATDWCYPKDDGSGSGAWLAGDCPT